MMLRLKPSLFLVMLFLATAVHAETSGANNTGADIAKVVWGLLVVLTVIAGLAWIIKKLTRIQTGGMSAARIVGAVSVGTRERVIVLEIANRWIVVGVAPGQVNAIANLDIVDNEVATPESAPSRAASGFLPMLLERMKAARPNNEN